MEQFELLESLGLINGDYIAEKYHLNRLQRSAYEFNFCLKLEQIKESLSYIKASHSDGSWKVRLLVSRDGSYDWQADKIYPIQQPANVNIAISPVDRKNLFLYHKTTNRKIYNELRINAPGIFDTLLWNERNEVTEFTIGNIVIEINNILYTPPVHCGLLNGTFREMLLDNGVILERTIYKKELEHATKIWLINSVREWIEVKIIT